MKQVSKLGLARESYISENILSQEWSKVFLKNWSFAGTVNDVINNGDYMCVLHGKNSLVIIRDHQGILKAFHNICRHRGTVLLKGKGNISETKGVQCGYHCWRYNLQGDLVSVPQESTQFEGINKKNFSLYPAAIKIFKGIIFVHSDEAQNEHFDEWLGDFKNHFGPYDLNDLEELYSQEYIMNANWKLFVENHIESYHLWYAHKNSILGLDHYKQVNHYYNGHWSFFQPTIVYGKMAEFEKYIPSTIIAPSKEWFGSGDHLLYPNFGIVTGAKFVAFLRVLPITSDKSQIEIRVFGKSVYAQVDFGSYYEESGSSKEYNVNLEDIELCEKVQQGMNSEYGGLGVLAKNYELSIQKFHEKYLNEMST